MKFPYLSPPKNNKYIGYVLVKRTSCEGTSSFLRVCLLLATTMIEYKDVPYYYTHSEISNGTLLIRRGIYKWVIINIFPINL